MTWCSVASSVPLPPSATWTAARPTYGVSGARATSVRSSRHVAGTDVASPPREADGERAKKRTEGAAPREGTASDARNSTRLWPEAGRNCGSQVVKMRCMAK